MPSNLKHKLPFPFPFQFPPIFFLFFLITISFAELCHPNDKKALLNIKKAFNNPYILTSWDPTTDCCHWYCVKCNRTTHRITALTIFADDRLSGQIPPAVGDLPFLEELRLHKLPNLTGPIQPAIAKLHNLRILDLSWNGLSGPVPEFLSTLHNLFDLTLSFNQLTGTIPGSLSNLPNLLGLRLDRNKLTGPIPDSLGFFPSESAPSLYLSHNQLSGKIPSSLGRLNLTAIDLSRNNLEGDAFMLFGSNKTVQIVDMSRNLLEFNMSEVVFPRSLTSLDVNHNKIYGGLSPEMTELNFQFLNVSYNRLCGEIPVGGDLQKFDLYSYFHNKCLCGAPLGGC